MTEQARREFLLEDANRRLVENARRLVGTTQDPRTVDILNSIIEAGEPVVVPIDELNYALTIGLSLLGKTELFIDSKSAKSVKKLEKIMQRSIVGEDISDAFSHDQIEIGNDHILSSICEMTAHLRTSDTKKVALVK